MKRRFPEAAKCPDLFFWQRLHTYFHGRKAKLSHSVQTSCFIEVLCDLSKGPCSSTWCQPELWHLCIKPFFHIPDKNWTSRLLLLPNGNRIRLDTFIVTVYTQWNFSCPIQWYLQKIEAYSTSYNHITKTHIIIMTLTTRGQQSSPPLCSAWLALKWFTNICTRP